MQTYNKDIEMKLTSEYTADEINAMRERLAESEWEGLKDRDLKLVLWHGCTGWNNISDEEIIAHYTECFGLDISPEDVGDSPDPE